METKNILSVIVISLLFSSGLLLEYKFELDYNTFYSDNHIAAREDWIVEYQRTYFRLDKYIPKAVVCDRYTKTRCYPAEPYWQRLNRVLSKIYLTEEKNEFGTLITKSTKYKDGSIRLDKIFTKNEPKIEEFPGDYEVNYDVGNKNRFYRLTWRIKNLGVSSYPEDNMIFTNRCKLYFDNKITVDWCNELDNFDYAELDKEKRTLLVHFNSFKGDISYNVKLFDPIYLGYQIGLNENDAYQVNEVMTNYTTAIMGEQWGNSYVAGFRFAIDVPKSSDITSSSLELAYNWGSGTNNSMFIFGENTDNATVFGFNDNNITNRIKTNSYSLWDSPHTGDWGTFGNTSDVSSIIEEIVGRAGWVSGNYIVFIFNGSDTNADEWEAMDYYMGGSLSAKLHINYDIVDSVSPIWRNMGDNESSNILNKEVINLSIEGKDLISFSNMTLATNETGVWKNRTCNIVFENWGFRNAFSHYDVYSNITNTLINKGIPQTLLIIINDSNNHTIDEDNTLYTYLNNTIKNSTIEFGLHDDIGRNIENYTESETRELIENFGSVMFNLFNINSETFFPSGGNYNTSAKEAFYNNNQYNLTRLNTYGGLTDWQKDNGMIYIPITTEFMDWGVSDMKNASEIEADCISGIESDGTCVIGFGFNDFNAGDNTINLTRYQTLLDVLDWYDSYGCNGFTINDTNEYVLDLITKDYSGNDWNWANWTWKNDSVKNTRIGWKVYLKDTLSNTNVSDISFFDVGSLSGDNTPPVITIHSPDKINCTTVPILRGICIDSETSVSNIWTNLTYYSTIDSTSPFNFSNTSEISLGTYHYLISCNDSENNIASSSSFFNLISSNPNVTFISPTEDTGNVISVNYYTVNTSITDEESISGLINWNYSLINWLRYDNYDFDIPDFSGYSNNGVYYGRINNNGTLVNMNTGLNNESSGHTCDSKHGNSLNFDGIDDYITIPDSASLKNDVITILLWIKPNSLYGESGSTGPFILSKYNWDGNLMGFWFGFDSSVDEYNDAKLWVNFGNGTGSQDYRTTNQYIDANSWQQIGFMLDGADVYAIYNGEIVESSTETWNYLASSDILKIGGGFEANREYNGVIDELQIYNRILSASEINATYINNTFNSNGLISYLRFDETNGLIAYDTNHLAYKNNQNMSKFKSSALFDGDNDYINCGTDGSLIISNSLTFETWIKSNNILQANKYVLSMGAWDDYNRFNIVINPSERLEVWFGNGTDYSGGAFDNYLNTKDWIHLVIVATEDTIYAYKNGALFGSFANALGNFETNNQFVLGKHYPGLSNYFNGSLDETKLWKRALDPSEINASYNAGLYRLYSNFTNLINGKYDYTAYSIDENGNVGNTETRDITYSSGDCTVHSDCYNQFCSYTGECMDYLINLSDCDGKEAFGLDADIACISNTTGWCYSDDWDGSGEFCTNNADKCVHDGSLYNDTYILCNANSWSKQCLSGNWQSQSNCDTTNDQCTSSGESFGCGYQLADSCTNDIGCVSPNCVDCGLYESLLDGSGCKSSISSNCNINCGSLYDSTNCLSPNILNNDCTCTYSASISDIITPNSALKGTEVITNPLNPIDDFSGTSFSSLEIDAIGVSDDWEVPQYGVAGENPFNKYNFSISTYDLIESIEFNHEGGSDGLPIRHLFVWNITGSVWNDIWSNSVGSPDNISTVTITDGWSDYISNHQISFMVEDNCTYCDLYCDYVNINFTYYETSSNPVFSDSNSNGTTVNTYVLHSLKWSDTTGLDSYIFSFDNGVGSFSNDTPVSMTGTVDWSNVSKVLVSTPGSTIRWKVYCNDTAGNLRESNTYEYVTTATSPFTTSVSHIMFNQSPTSYYKHGVFDLNRDYSYLSCPWGGKATCYDNFKEDVDIFVKYGGSNSTTILFGNGFTVFDMTGRSAFQVGFWNVTEWIKKYNDDYGTDVQMCWRRFGDGVSLDFSNPTVRYNMIDDAYTAVTGDGGLHEPFDCIFEDTEPITNGDPYYIQFLKEQLENVTVLGKKTGAVTYGIIEGQHQYEWNMNKTFVNEIATYCNFTVPMLYISCGFNTDEDMYVNWYRNQMDLYYEAIGDSQTKVISWGIANYPTEPGHNPTIENPRTVTKAIYWHTNENYFPELGSLYLFAHCGTCYTEGDYEWMRLSGSYNYTENVKIKVYVEESINNMYISILDSDTMGYVITNQSAIYNATSGFYEADLTGFPTTAHDGNYTVRVYVTNAIGGGYVDSKKNSLHIIGPTTDVTPPVITITRPISTELSELVWFNVTLDETGDVCRYSLNGANNITMSGSSMSFYASNASMVHKNHNIYFNCNDTAGNLGVKDFDFTVDLNPTSNSPGDASYGIDSSNTINWILYTTTSTGYYKTYRDGNLQNDSTSWINNTNLNVWINTSKTGTFNYTIIFNDSTGRNGLQDDIVIIITGGNDGSACTLDSDCTSGYCDNDGVYGTDDNWCFNPYNSYFDGEETPYCEYSAGVGLDKCDELAVGTNLYECVGLSYYAEECSSTCNYIDITSVFECTDTGCSCSEPLCDGRGIGYDLPKCSWELSYFGDECAPGASGRDETVLCRSSDFHNTCTANSNCNGIVNNGYISKCIGLSYYEDKCNSVCEIEDITSVFECTDTDCSCTLI